MRWEGHAEARQFIVDVQAIPRCLGRLRIRLHSYGIQMNHNSEGLCRRIRQGDKHVRSLASARMGFESFANVTPGATLALRQMQGEVITGEWILVLVNLHIDGIFGISVIIQTELDQT